MNGMRHRLQKNRAVWQSKAEHGECIPPEFPIATRNRRIIQSNGLLTNLPMMQYGRFMSCALRGVVRLKLQGSWKKKFYCQSLIMNPSGERLAESLRTIYSVGIRKLLSTLKVQNTIYKLKEEHQVIPDMQETIIFEKQWLRVQELRQRYTCRILNQESYLFYEEPRWFVEAKR